MGGLISRVKTWISKEIIYAADLNNEFNNILNNLDLKNVGLVGLSDNLTNFKKIKDPGTVGGENLPVNGMEEIQEIRSMLKKITGGTQWYDPPSNSLSVIASGVGANSFLNRIDSGKEDTNGMPQVLACDGTTLTLQIKATATPLVYEINGTQYTLAADATLALTAGPASNNTCLVDDADGLFGSILNSVNAGQTDTSPIKLKTVGTEISNLSGKLAAFKLASTDTEFFICRVGNNGTFIHEGKRVFFFSAAGTIINVGFSDGQVLTILKLNYIFIKTDGTCILTNNEPSYSSAQPSSPASGDLWFDSLNNKWKLYSGSGFVDANCAFLGYAVCTSTACVGVRTVDFFRAYSPICDLSLFNDTISGVNPQVRSNGKGGKVSVYGKTFDFGTTSIIWNTSTNMEAGTVYSEPGNWFYYLDNQGNPKISSIKPTDRQEDLKGWYHPYKPWRCLGQSRVINSAFGSFNIQNYGADAYIPDHCLSKAKLSPYINSPLFVRNEGVPQLEISFSSGGSSNPVSIRWSGRPVLVLFSPVSSSTNPATMTTDGYMEIRLQYRIPFRDNAWANFSSGGATPQPTALSFASLMHVPSSLIWLDLPKEMTNEIIQYRLNVTAVSGTTFGLAGILYAIEL
jgi:hypothetical protein